MKVRDVTPISMRCAGGACPAIYETDRETFLIVGSLVEIPEGVPPEKVGQNERLIEVPIDLVRKMQTNR